MPPQLGHPARSIASPEAAGWAFRPGVAGCNPKRCPRFRRPPRNLSAVGLLSPRGTQGFCVGCSVAADLGWECQVGSVLSMFCVLHPWCTFVPGCCRSDKAVTSTSVSSHLEIIAVVYAITKTYIQAFTTPDGSFASFRP